MVIIWQIDTPSGELYAHVIFIFCYTLQNFDRFGSPPQFYPPTIFILAIQSIQSAFFLTKFFSGSYIFLLQKLCTIWYLYFHCTLTIHVHNCLNFMVTCWSLNFFIIRTVSGVTVQCKWCSQAGSSTVTLTFLLL